MPGSCRGGKGDQHKILKASSGTSAGYNELHAHKTPRLSKKFDVRVSKRTEAPTLVSHILLQQALLGYPRQHLTIMELASEVPGRKPDYC
jgi:hypothetical protein